MAIVRLKKFYRVGHFFSRVKPSLIDKIIAVGQGKDGEIDDIVGLRLQKIINRIRGKQNTQVRLLIESGDGSGRKTVTLVRDQIKLVNQMASARCFEGKNGNLGVIEFTCILRKKS
jgi:carboxyl-terminal processing protease